ncbi:hypothetical protein VFPPC_13287 [Pochonia chlamydosporia 170]|uniref:Uncharacterized protein n=1 Tax=Pochonia chlamydosporia 170 TaxID=1380566 RepID=A0A179FXZ0_METCM|nr:hypothetical protein VFPPC_13287 [Pochonia chlamydosporia 170]OAQ69971.1 hypothetical protein VFPPC_13287 [Pochonia chlamydosporia 170]
MKAFTALRSSIHLITDNGRIPSEIRRCLELVQTCHRDLQHLIDLRNEHLEFLETAPQSILARVNQVIDAANHGLVEVRCIVEKYRPKEHMGMKTPLHNQMEWMMGSSAKFRSQEAVIIRHNAAVLAELNYLRQITMWKLAAVTEDAVVVSNLRESSVKSGNSHQAGDCLSSNPHIPTKITPSSTFSMPRKPSGNVTKYCDLPEPIGPTLSLEYCDLPEPVFPNALPESTFISNNIPGSLKRTSSTIVKKSHDNASSCNVVLSPATDHGLSILFDQ